MHNYLSQRYAQTNKHLKSFRSQACVCLDSRKSHNSQHFPVSQGVLGGVGVEAGESAPGFSQNSEGATHWLPVHFWAQFKVLVMTYKALYGSGPGYLKDRILPYEPAHALRSSGEALLSVPPSSQVHLGGTWERSFSVASPVLWNSLPGEARLAPSLMSFWKQAKKQQLCFGRLLVNNLSFHLC